MWLGKGFTKSFDQLGVRGSTPLAGWWSLRGRPKTRKRGGGFCGKHGRDVPRYVDKPAFPLLPSAPPFPPHIFRLVARVAGVGAPRAVDYGCPKGRKSRGPPLGREWPKRPRAPKNPPQPCGVHCQGGACEQFELLRPKIHPTRNESRHPHLPDLAAKQKPNYPLPPRLSAPPTPIGAGWTPHPPAQGPQGPQTSPQRASFPLPDRLPAHSLRPLDFGVPPQHPTRTTPTRRIGTNPPS